MVLLAHWPFNDIGSSFNDVSGNGRHGSFNGMGLGDIHKGYTVSGRTGCYFHISAVGDLAGTVPGNAVFQLNESFTVEGYFYWPSDRIAAYPRTTTYMDFPALLSMDINHDSGGNGWLFYYEEPNQPAANAAALAGPHGKREGRVRGGGGLSTNTWHHLRWDYDQVTKVQRSLLDGVVMGTDIIHFSNLGSTSALRFGSNPNYGYHQKARAVFSDLKIWNELRAPSTVRPPLRQRQRLANTLRQRQRLVNTPRMRQQVR